MLEIINSSKLYGKFFALQDVSLEIYPGEVYAFVGENGAGKSTLVKLITGLEKSSKGDLFWLGKKYSANSPNEAISQGIVAVQQELTIIETMTVSENIWLGHEPKNKLGTIDFKKMNHDAEELLNRIGFSLNVSDIVDGLSMADKHLVEIAKAFSYNPKLLVLDEATSAIGETEVEKLKEAIDKFKTNGGSVIFISHRMKELFNFCDRCLILKDGKKVITETIGNLDKDSIVKYMTGRDLKQGYFPDKIDYNEIEKEKNVLEIVNLSTRSGVKNCNFSIRRGEIVGLGGLQGQGQIAFIQALFGMDKITSGSIIAADKKIKIRNTRDSIRNGLLLVPQDRKQEGLFIEDSVANNLVSCSLKKISTSGFIRNKQKNKLIREIVNRMNIKTGNWSQSMKSLSGGNQQKVALGKWLVHDAKVIMLIEPTRGIDITTKTEIYRLLRELSNKGYAIIISTNELLELVGISDRVIVMYERNMIAQLIGENISEEKIVAASFGEI